MGFLNPAAFAFSIFIAALIALYLWERNQRRVDVPSLLLWQSIPEAVPRRRRFQPDRLFWFQLAALSALVLALANPYFKSLSPGEPLARTIIVIDLSASMQAREGSASRLDMAKARARKTLQSLPQGAELMLIKAARDASTSGFTRDHQWVASQIEALVADDTAANLESALAIAQRSAAGSDLHVDTHVMTDVRRDTVAGRWRRGFHWWPVGSSDDNLAISGVAIDQGALQDHHNARVRVSVRNFSNRERHRSLAVSIAGQPIGSELFTLGPRAELHFHFTELPTSGVVEARLADDDALRVDDVGYGWVRPSAAIRVAVVAPPSPLRLALLRLSAATDAVSVSANDTLESVDLSTTDVVILHTDTPESEPDRPTLRIASATATTDGAARRIDVLDWNERHPVLRGIDPRRLRSLPAVANVARPAWGEAVLRSRTIDSESDVLIVGENAGRRRALLAVDLGSEDLLATDRESLLLLIVNLLDWLAHPDDASPVLQTGESWSAENNLTSEPNRATTITEPSGATTVLQPESAAVFPINKVGTYELEHNGGRSLVYAGFIDANESDIGRPPPQPYRATGAGGSGAAAAGEGLRVWLLMAAALLLVAEWVAAVRGA